MLCYILCANATRRRRTRRKPPVRQTRQPRTRAGFSPPIQATLPAPRPHFHHSSLLLATAFFFTVVGLQPHFETYPSPHVRVLAAGPKKKKQKDASRALCVLTRGLVPHTARNHFCRPAGTDECRACERASRCRNHRRYRPHDHGPRAPSLARVVMVILLAAAVLGAALPPPLLLVQSRRTRKKITVGE